MPESAVHSFSRGPQDCAINDADAYHRVQPPRLAEAGPLQRVTAPPWRGGKKGRPYIQVAPCDGAHLERHCTTAATATGSCARTCTVARRAAARWPGLALGYALPVAPNGAATQYGRARNAVEAPADSEAHEGPRSVHAPQPTTSIGPPPDSEAGPRFLSGRILGARSTVEIDRFNPDLARHAPCARLRLVPNRTEPPITLLPPARP